MPMPKIITRICFFWQEIVQYAGPRKSSAKHSSIALPVPALPYPPLPSPPLLFPPLPSSPFPSPSSFPSPSLPFPFLLFPFPSFSFRPFPFPFSRLGSLGECLKIIGKEFPKNCYKTIFRNINTKEIFSNLHSLQIKTIFQEKSSICENLLSRYMWFISMVVTSLVPIVNVCVNIVSKYCLFIS